MVAFFNKIKVNFNDSYLRALKSNYKELQSKFGENLKRLRQERNLSLRELAAKCDLYDGKISKIENGQYNIQLSTIFELAKGLEVQPKDLMDFPL
jgi:DNA-binding Xre family transcriptional regulator